MSDLTDQLERLMAFAGEDARAAFWDLPAAVCDGKSDAHSFECGARYQHQRDLEVLMRMAACLEKCVEAIDSLEGHMPVGADVFDTAKNTAASARAEIARLGEGGE